MSLRPKATHMGRVAKVMIVVESCHHSQLRVTLLLSESPKIRKRHMVLRGQGPHPSLVHCVKAIISLAIVQSLFSSTSRKGKRSFAQTGCVSTVSNMVMQQGNVEVIHNVPNVMENTMTLFMMQIVTTVIK